MHAIELRQVEKKYKNDIDSFKLDKINSKFEYGKLYAIIGHSGSGKSTLLKIIGTLLKPDDGDVLINGENVSKINDTMISKIRNKEIGFVFQNYNLDNDLNSYDNVLLPMVINKEIKKSKRKEIVLKLFEKFGLNNKMKKYPNELSGGEQARVALCRALVNDPKIILADEPTGNLDKNNEKMIFELFKMIVKEGKCVIIVSHSNEIKKYADVILKIENGKIIDE